MESMRSSPAPLAKAIRACILLFSPINSESTTARVVDSLPSFAVSSLRLGRVVTMLEDNAAASPAGKCDGCGAADVPLMKISLGRDFFGRVYDRLSPSADLSPKWYCDH